MSRVRFASQSAWVRCALCARKFRAVTALHLRYKHGLDSGEAVGRYKARYGLMSTFSGHSRRLRSQLSKEYYRRQGKSWSRERVVREIRRRRGRGKALSSVQVSKEWRALHDWARRYFGSWGRALGAAGIDETSVRRQKRWTRRLVIEGLRAAYDVKDKSKNPALLQENKALICAAIRKFGTLGDALRVAGIPQRPKRVSRYRTKEQVLQAIRRRAQEGRSLRPSVVLDEDAALHQQARRLFEKPWLEVLREHGIEHDSRNRWTAGLVIDEIRRLAREKAKLNSKAIEARPGGLYDAGYRYFGNWRQALKAARIDPRLVYVNEKWSRDRIKAVVHELAIMGEPLGYQSLRRKGFHSLLTSGCTYFKKPWSKVVEEILGKAAVGTGRGGRPVRSSGKEKAEQRAGSLSRQRKARAISAPGVEVIIARQ